MRTAPFLGTGLAFPPRINNATGGFVNTIGLYDNISVALEYLRDSWSIRERLDHVANHIAESIAHILLTVPTEHDTLPEFGSRLFTVIFEPNSQEFRIIATAYFQNSTIRWEKRAQFKEVGWVVDGLMIDRGELPCIANLQFILAQTPQNLVSPFVTPRQARLQEYNSSYVDVNYHDQYSRYKGSETAMRDGIRYTRLRYMRPLREAFDDSFYQITPKDTWYLISWFNYGDIRYASYIARAYIYDCAKAGLSREVIDITHTPEAGTLLRMPSLTRMRMAVL